MTIRRRHRKPYLDKAPQRHYLDTPYSLEIVALEQVEDLLKPLASNRLSLLPSRMRNALGRTCVELASFRRELERFPEQVSIEKREEHVEDELF